MVFFTIIVTQALFIHNYDMWTTGEEYFVFSNDFSIAIVIRKSITFVKSTCLSHWPSFNSLSSLHYEFDSSILKLKYVLVSCIVMNVFLRQQTLHIASCSVLIINLQVKEKSFVNALSENIA